MDIISQIERAMVARNISRAELARRIGHGHSSAITRLLQRQHEPSVELLQRIATALETELVLPATAELRIVPSAPETCKVATA